MQIDFYATVIPAFVSLLTVGVAVWQLVQTRRKIEAETKQMTADAAKEVSAATIMLLQPLRERILNQENEIKQLKVCVFNCRTVLRELGYEIEDCK